MFLSYYFLKHGEDIGLVLELRAKADVTQGKTKKNRAFFRIVLPFRVRESQALDWGSPEQEWQEQGQVVLLLAALEYLELQASAG